MNESWKEWFPVEYSTITLNLLNLTDNNKGLTLIYYDYKNPKIRIIVNFYEPVLSYRNTEEASSIKTFFYLSKKYGQDFVTKGFAFKAKNSGYIQWLNTQNGGLYDLEDITHYAFITNEETTEILSLYPPKITLVNHDDGTL